MDMLGRDLKQYHPPLRRQPSVKQHLTHLSISNRVQTNCLQWEAFIGLLLSKNLHDTLTLLDSIMWVGA